MLPIPPAIISQPASQSVAVGSTATFVVSASGTAPLNYQWQFNGGDITNATGSSLVLTNVQFANAGTYSVTITNASGSITSSNAVLTVNFPPAAIQVLSGSGPAGGAVRLPVTLVAVMLTW